ncbi:MAG: MBL fold metallo-hydrolase [Nitrososphaerota archaeon]|nr:MBL fold metallo-hydrolase [Nitrososphaerota archaeon]
MQSADVAKHFILLQLVRSHTGCASYILGSKTDKSCIIVDPLMDAERYQWTLEEHGFKVLALIDTHTHADHLSGLRELSQFFPSAFLAVHESAPVRFPCEKLRDGERLNDRLPDEFSKQEIEIKVIHTPGHALDHVCLLIEPKDGSATLLSGDCLFIEDVGRTDLGRGDNHKMYDSLFNKLLKLDPRTEVYPAHIGAKHFLQSQEMKTTIGDQMETNPALQVKNEQEFVKYMTEDWPPKPEYYQDFVRVNLGQMPLAEAQERIIRENKSKMEQKT